MLKLTGNQLDWLVERIPDHTPSPKGGRPPVGKRKAIQGVFWILDNGARWKDLLRRFGSKSAVHRLKKSTMLFQGFLHLGCTLLLLKEGLG